MNLGGKQDLDAVLRSWPAPLPKGVEAGADEERGWESRAEAITRAAVAARDAGGGDAALFDAPALDPEAGESSAIRAAAGEKKMANDKEPGESPVSAPPPPATERKRSSLKELAARASQSSQSGARLSQPGTPPPPSVAPAARLSQPTPLPRPVEATKDDSGVINLNVVNNAATAQQHADAAKAKPGQAGLFEDDKPAEAAKPAVAAAAASNVTPIQPKRSNMGAIGGVAIAVVGIAAAFMIMARKPPPPPPAPVVEAKATPTQAAPTQAPVNTATPAPVASADPAPTPSAEPDAKVAEAAKTPSGPMPSGAATAPGTAAAASTGAAKVASSDKPGDLATEMAKRVGKDPAAAGADQAPAPTPEPASAPRNGNLPEQPSQGAVAAAFGPVMVSAKACVAGADDVSRASVTFSSAGSVTSVSVSGWAAAHGKGGCVQAALKGAKVSPFSKPSFTVGVPIRPN